MKPAIVKTNGVIRDLLHPGTLELDIFDSKASDEPSKPMNEGKIYIEINLVT